MTDCLNLCSVLVMTNAEAMNEMRQKLNAIAHAEHVDPYDMTDEQRCDYYTGADLDPIEEWND